ncbi:hypothetical protein GGF46_000614 [Coemansia sp. RSA 552]|nr:hypothetical protein GGF46_000614 [Coemansia sp. RSA 552]
MPKTLERLSLDAGFPIAAIAVTAANKIVLGGGGGPGRSGVQNKLAIYSTPTQKGLKKVAELVLSSTEDAPTCLAAHPKDEALVASVNQDKETIEAGKNNNCRVFTVASKKVKAGKSTSSICSTSDMEYQKSVVFSPSGRLVAGGATDGTLAVLEYPSLRPQFPFVDAVDEINDVDFSGDSAWVVAVTDAELKVLAVSDAGLVKSIEQPHTQGEDAVFRFARFGRGQGSIMPRGGGGAVDVTSVLYTVLNTRSRKNAYIVQWDTKSWSRLATRLVASSAITTIAMSRDGSLMAFATASLQIAICDARSLKVLMRIPKAHGFAITALAFDRETRYLVSGSADETCRVFVLPDKWPTPVDMAVAFAQDYSRVIAILVVFLATLLALALRN